MADSIMIGSPNPAVTTTRQTQATLPEFYTNYLQDVANLGANAVQQGGVAGFSPLQQQAFQMAPNAAFSGAQTAGDAASLLGASGTTAAPSMVGAYMNPYMSNVVDEMSRLQQQNIQRSILPALRGAGVNTGSFGSTRQANITGQALADMQRNLTGQQYNALYSGYGDAMKAAQADLSRQLQAGQGLGNVAQEQYQIGTGGLKTLSDLGTIQQQQGQRMLDYPMLQAQNYAKLFGTPTIPGGSTEQTVGAANKDVLTPSPLGQITSLITGLGSILNPQQPSAQSTANAPVAGSNPYGLDTMAKQAIINTGNAYLRQFLGLKKGGSVKPLPSHMQDRIKKIRNKGN